MKALFSSQEGHFSFRWIRGILAIRRRACSVTSERYIGGLWACDALALEIEDGICGNSSYWFSRRPLLVRMPKAYYFLSVAL